MSLREQAEAENATAREAESTKAREKRTANLAIQLKALVWASGFDDVEFIGRTKLDRFIPAEAGTMWDQSRPANVQTIHVDRYRLDDVDLEFVGHGFVYTSNHIPGFYLLRTCECGRLHFQDSYTQLVVLFAPEGSCRSNRDVDKHTPEELQATTITKLRGALKGSHTRCSFCRADVAETCPTCHRGWSA